MENRASLEVLWRDQKQVAHAYSDFLLTVTIIVKTIIGASILAMPYTFNQMGYVFAIIIVLGSLAVNQFGSLLLLKAKNMSRHSNYTSLFFAVWKSKAAKAIASLLIILNNYGFCIKTVI